MQLTGTEIQGMMAESWTSGTELSVTKAVSAVCIDGRLWELRGNNDRVLLTINPCAAVTCKELKTEIETAVRMAQRQESNRYYLQSGCSD